MKVRSAREAIRCLDTANDFFKVIGASYFEGVLELAMSALEKQIPKKPEEAGITRNGINGNGESENCFGTQEDCYECPACGSFLGYASDCKDDAYQCNYCSECGQAIDWSNDKNE